MKLFVLFGGNDLHNALLFLGVFACEAPRFSFGQFYGDNMLDNGNLCFKLLGGGVFGLQKALFAGLLDLGIQSLENKIQILNTEIPQIFSVDASVKRKAVFAARRGFKHGFDRHDKASLKFDFEYALGSAGDTNNKGIITANTEPNAGKLVPGRFDTKLASQRFKNPLVFHEFVHKEFIIKTIRVFRIDAVFEHEEPVLVTDTILSVPIVGRTEKRGDRSKTVGGEPPDIAALNIGIESGGQGEFSVLIKLNGSDFYDFVILKSAWVAERVDLSVKFDLCPESGSSAAIAKTMHIKPVFSTPHIIYAGPGDVFYGRGPLARMDDIYIKLSFGGRMVLCAKINVHTIRSGTVGVEIIGVIVLAIVPLNGEAKRPVNFSTGFLDVGADIAVGKIAGISPSKRVSPLEHGFCGVVFGGGKRNHMGRVLAFQVDLHLTRRRKDAGNKVVHGNFLHTVKSLGGAHGLTGQSVER